MFLPIIRSTFCRWPAFVCVFTLGALQAPAVEERNPIGVADATGVWTDDYHGDQWNLTNEGSYVYGDLYVPLSSVIPGCDDQEYQVEGYISPVSGTGGTSGTYGYGDLELTAYSPSPGTGGSCLVADFVYYSA
jgi:hypothetical protein